MVWNSPNPSIEKPCTGKCTIIGMNAGLEFADGTDANTDQKMWLHHVCLSHPPSRKSLLIMNRWSCSTSVPTLGTPPVNELGVFSSVCPANRGIGTVFGLPHMIVGSLPATSERIFSSGNERTMIPFNLPVSCRPLTHMKPRTRTDISTTGQHQTRRRLPNLPLRSLRINR